MNSWITISDTIIASGGEQYITIGSFAATPNSQSTGTTTGWAHVYMYIDDVQVYLLQGVYGDTTACAGDTIELYSTLDTNVSWVESTNPTNVLSNNDTFTVVPTQTTTYWAITTTDTQAVTVHYIDVAGGFVGADADVCEGDSVERLVNMPGFSLLWSDGETDSLLVTTDSGYHTLWADTAGCQFADSFHVAYHQFPSLDLGNDTAICHYDDLSISTGLGNSVLHSWSTGASQPQITAIDTGLFWVDVTNSYCTFRDSIVVTYRPPVLVELGNDSHFCYQTSVSMNSYTQNANSYQWSTGSSSNSITVSVSGTYTLTASDGYCYDEDSAHYDLLYLPMVDLGNDTSFCNNESVKLDANQPAGVDVFWSTSQATNQVEINQTGLYWVRVSDPYCTMIDSINIDMYPVLHVTLGEDLELCDGDSISLEPSVNQSVTEYYWSTGETTSTIPVKSEGSFMVTVSNGLCEARDEINVFFFEYPKVDLGNDTLVCPGSELTFDVKTEPDVVEYKWFDGTTQPSHVLPSAADVWYWVKVTNVVCSSVDSIHIGHRSLPMVDLGEDLTMCEGTPIRLTPLATQPGASMMWSNGMTDSSVVITKEGTYRLDVNDGYCSNSDSIKVHIAPVPTPLKLEGPSELCVNEQLVLNVQDPLYSSYRWNDGSTWHEKTITEPGTYSVEAVHACGVDADTIHLERCECSVFVPSAFTPSGGVVNEEFTPVLDCRVLEYTFKVYDRWGEVLFESKSIDNAWDGTFKGVDAPTGTYAWTLTMKAVHDGEVMEMEKHGSVALLR